MGKRVLVVDDEESILTLLKFNLEKEGYEVTTATDGVTAYDLASSKDFDFIVLDLMLPKMDGMDVCKRLRQDKNDTPILILTAKDDELEKIIGLELGADDYMTKPFSPREVLARMKAILRRSRRQSSNKEEAVAEETPREKGDQEEAEENETAAASPEDDEEGEIIKVGDIVIDTSSFSVTVRGEEVSLTPKEFELLTYMAKRVNRTLSRERLLQKIWDFDYTGETRIVDIHISHLREKIEEDPRHPQYIITVRGFGYRFEVPKTCEK